MQTLEYKKSAVDLTDLAIGIVVLGIVVSVGATILINVRDTNTGTTTNIAYNLSNSAAVGLAEYGNWFKIIVIVGVAAVILSLIFMAFGGRSSQGSVGY